MLISDAGVQIVRLMDTPFAINRKAREAGMRIEEMHAPRTENAAWLVETRHTPAAEIAANGPAQERTGRSDHLHAQP